MKFEDLSSEAPVLEGAIPADAVVERKGKKSKVALSNFPISPFEFVLIERVLDKVEKETGKDMTPFRWGYELAVDEPVALANPPRCICGSALDDGDDFCSEECRIRGGKSNG